AIPAYRLKAVSKIMIIVFVLLAIRIGYIQFVQGAELKELASRQQTLNKIISPKRGCIYDTNGKALAMSAGVDTITINPAKFIVKKSSNIDETTAKYKTIELQEKVAKGLSEIFSLDYETVLAQVKSENSVETIIKQVEKDLVDKLETWMKENEIKSGINIDEDNKRYYPYGNLASHVIGFTGTDSQGLYGIENKWDSELKGTSR
ncbi:MAG: peptidoglycan glycosyltransferase, partial [Clostridia bacterium]|nr:peptidoglycan glycosyltransferase [Clostridia bacterium]